MKLNYKFLIYFFLASVISTFLFFQIIDVSLKRYTLHYNTISVPSLVGLSLPMVQDTLDKYDLQFTIIDSAAYNPNYNRGSVLSHFPRSGSQVKSGRKIYITINPLKINYIALPYLKNKSLRQAISLLENNAFRVGNLYYTKHFAKDVIRFAKLGDQIVDFNDTLPKFSIIDLYLGDGYSNGISIPNLKGLEFREIRRKLNNNSLNLGECYIPENISDTTVVFIYKQEPEANEKVSLGSFVSVWGTDSLNNINTSK